MSKLPKPVLDAETSSKIDAIPDRHKSQLERFKETAKQLEADQSYDSLDNIMGKLNLTKKPEEAEKKED